MCVCKLVCVVCVCVLFVCCFVGGFFCFGEGGVFLYISD